VLPLIRLRPSSRPRSSTLALVNINSNIVHDQQSPFGLALPHANTKLKLLSCYLTPIHSAHRKPSARKSNDTMIEATTLIVSSLCKALIMTAPQLSTRAEYMIGDQGFAFLRKVARIHGYFSSQSFWKAGSARNGSEIADRLLLVRSDLLRA
jgi:hypothetical protein